MRPLATVLVAMALAFAGGVACSSKPEDRLNGRWAIDVEAMVTRETLKDQLRGLNPEAQEQRLASARAEAAHIGLEVEAGKLIVETGVDRKETRFTVRKEGEKLFLDTDDGNGQTGAIECRFEGDKLKMTWGGTELLFVKR